jgi:phytoene/squalene synthetase
MKELYDKVSMKSSKLLTRTYSTSFSIGINLLDKKLHDPIYAIYGFVRLADEVVDSFHDFPKADLLREIRVETFKAIEIGISVNPVIQSFQQTVRKYQIDHELVDKFLDSMEQDLEDVSYSNDLYDEYIVGSAEVVGLMCLKVFVEGDIEKYKGLKYAARKLGSAFQKVNFLRDMKSDYLDLGRVYFPDVQFENFSLIDKLSIEKDIEKDFNDALDGIKLLPKSSKLGVYVAYRYYRSLFDKIRSISPADIMNERIRIPNSKKLYLACESIIATKLKRI